MKKKQTIAILLSVLLLTSVTLPGTWANEDPVGDVVNDAEPEAAPKETPVATESDTESDTVEDTESDTETETETETEPESETETETEIPPETAPETTPDTDTVIVEVEETENKLLASFNLLMEDTGKDSRTKWNELRTLFELDESMGVLTILNTIAEKLELQLAEIPQFIAKFQSMIETILDEIKDGVVDGDLQAQAQLLYEKIMSCTLIEDIWVAIEGADPAVVDVMSEEQISDIEAHVEENEPEPLPEIVIEESEPPVPSEIYTPTVNFVNVAPLVGAE